MTSFAGRIDEHLAVEHVVRLAVGEFDTERLGPHDDIHRGADYLEVVKAVEHDGGAPVDTSPSTRKGRRVDAAEMLGAVDARRYEKFGRIHETLSRTSRSSARSSGSTSSCGP